MLVGIIILVVLVAACCAAFFLNDRQHCRREAHLYQRIADLEQVADAEFDRALTEGKAQVHRFMVDANWNLYNAGELGPRTRAVFQDAERMFSPDYKEEGVKA